MLKQAGVIALVSLNTLMIGLALGAHRQRRSLPDPYYRLLPFSALLGMLQVSVGLYFLLQGKQAHLMHLIYGGLVGGGALLQWSVQTGSALGQTYRNRPLIHIALALFVALLAVRSWLSG